MELIEMITNIMTKNGLVMSFLVVGAVMAVANYKIMMKTLRAYHEWANS